MGWQEIIGERIRKLRDQKGWSQTILGQKLKSPKKYQAIHRLETGKTKLKIKDLENIAEALNINLNTLLMGKTTKKEYPYLKKISAGKEPCSLESSKQIINLNELFPTGSLYCILQVDGQKMKHTGIFKDDWVLIDTGEKEIKDGELYAIGIFDKNQKEAPAKIKRLRKRGNDIIVIGGERHYDIEFYKKHQIKIVGKVVKIIKDIK